MDPSLRICLRLSVEPCSLYPWGSFRYLSTTRSRRCGGGRGGKRDGPKKAVSVSLGPGEKTEFLAGRPSRFRPRPDRPALGLSESMTSTTVRHRVASGQSSIQPNQTSRQRTVPVRDAAIRCWTVGTDCDWSWSFSPLQRAHAFSQRLDAAVPQLPGRGATESSISGDCNACCGPFSTEETSCDSWRLDALWRKELRPGTLEISAPCANVDETLS